MRVETSVTALPWIPSEALPSGMRLPFDWGVTHYDAPPPDRIEDLDALRQADRFRFANRLSVWAEVEDGRIVSHGRAGGGLIGSTTVRLARRDLVFTAYPLPDLCPEPEVTATSVRFTQTAGGRAGLPFPRPVDEPPHVRLVPPSPGPQWRSRFTQTAEPSVSSAEPAPSRDTGSMTRTAT